MRPIVLAGVLLLSVAAVARAEPGDDLAPLFREFCDARSPSHPACHDDVMATAAYKWLLLADACDHAEGLPYCARFAAIRVRTEPCVVAYSHRDGRWRARYRLETTERWAYDTDVNGIPTIVVSRSDRCTPLVEDTNPLVYGVQLGDVKEEDSALAGGLKDLADLLGATLAAAAPILTTHWTIAPNAGARRTIHDLRAGGARTTPFEELAFATIAVARSLVSVGDLKGEYVAALNAAEASETGTLTPVDWTRAQLDPAWWHDDFEQLRRSRTNAVESLGGLLPDKAQEAVLDQAQKVLDRQTEIAETVGALAASRARWDQFVVGSRMLTWMVASLRPQTLKWTKDQVHSIKVVVDTPFASEVATRRSKVDSSVRLTSPKASMFGVGAGLIVTPLQQVTYKAVTAADGEKRITATGHDSRTGQLALFIDWRFVQAWHPAASMWVVRPALEGGVAVDTKTPGFFLGASVELTKWLRLSAGRTWQNVTVLDGQREGDPVENDAAIALHDRFARGRYVSLSLAIDQLPLFSSK